LSSEGFSPRYEFGLVAGERENLNSKISFSIDVTKIMSPYLITIEIEKKGFG
jgi:hypothetical protein